MLTRKQKLYLDILKMLLPFFRNIQTHSAWRRFNYGAFYPEMELVHNLPQLLVVAEFTEHDIHWLNSQARVFVKDGNNSIHALHEPITACISELFTLVPETLKSKLTWNGPADKDHGISSKVE